MARLEYNRSGARDGELILATQDISMAGATNLNLDGWNKNATTKAEIVDFWIILKAVGPVAASTISLRVGAGEDTETFVVALTPIAVATTADKTVMRALLMDDSKLTIEKGESLNILIVASSGTMIAKVCVLLKMLGD